MVVGMEGCRVTLVITFQIFSRQHKCSLLPSGEDQVTSTPHHPNHHWWLHVSHVSTLSHVPIEVVGVGERVGFVLVLEQNIFNYCQSINLKRIFLMLFPSNYDA